MAGASKTRPRPAKPPRTKPPSAAEPSDAPTAVDAEVLEFIAALDRYKQQHCKPFPGWSEVLLVLKQLGYRKG